MVESKLGFFEVEMKALAGNTSVVIEPSLGIGEETFNTVDMGSPANVFLFAVQDPVVFSSRGEVPISLKVIGVVLLPLLVCSRMIGIRVGLLLLGTGKVMTFPFL